MELIFKLPPPDAGSPLPCPQRVPCLYHEVLDDPVEQTVVVVPTSTQGQEVLGRREEGREEGREGGREEHRK